MSAREFIARAAKDLEAAVELLVTHPDPKVRASAEKVVTAYRAVMDGGHDVAAASLMIVERLESVAEKIEQLTKDEKEKTDGEAA